MGIAMICAVLFFVNIVAAHLAAALGGPGPAGAVLDPARPDLAGHRAAVPGRAPEADKEQPYIEKNIDATRAAYDLEDVEVKPYTGTSDADRDQQAAARSRPSSGSGWSTRRWSSRRSSSSQQVRALLLGGRRARRRPLQDQRHRPRARARRSASSTRTASPDDGKNWSNLHTVYTHGNGVIAAFGNQRAADDSPDQLRRPSGPRARHPPRTS